MLARPELRTDQTIEIRSPAMIFGTYSAQRPAAHSLRRAPGRRHKMSLWVQLESALIPFLLRRRAC
jgi:hypothetical protein